MSKKKRLEKYKTVAALLENKFQYIVDYDYKRTDCDGSCREYNDYCRCTKLYDAKVKSVNGIYEYILDFGESIEQKYILDRLYSIHKMYDCYNYDVQIGGGYYGQEIYGVTFNEFDKLCENLDRLFCMDFKSAILALFELEYNFIPDFILDLKFEISKFPLNYINPVMTKKNNINCILNCDIPIAVIYYDGNKHSIIDGNHRINKALLEKIRYVDVILCRK